MQVPFNLTKNSLVGECSSVVEHSTADREVVGSIPTAPYGSKLLFEWAFRNVANTGSIIELFWPGG